MIMEKILIINGPNLNLLGTREPGIYGSETMEAQLDLLKRKYPEVVFEYFQSNHEGALIDRIHAADHEDFRGVVLNAGAYTHTSLAIADAIAAVGVPVVEVHISSILAREEFRHVSLLASVAVGSVMGFGLDSYRLGIEALLERARASALQQ